MDENLAQYMTSEKYKVYVNIKDQMFYVKLNGKEVETAGYSKAALAIAWAESEV